MSEKRVHCDHCNEYVSRRTYRRHMFISKLNTSKDIEDEWVPPQENHVNEYYSNIDEVFNFQNEDNETSTVCFFDDDDVAGLTDDKDEDEHEDHHDVNMQTMDDYSEVENDEVYVESDDDEEDVNQQPKVLLSPQMRSVLLFLLMWQFLFNVSDAGISMLIVFLYQVFKLLHSNNVMPDWLVNFPTNLHAVRFQVIGNTTTFLEYIVCPNCHSLYDITDGIVTSGSIEVSRKCQYIQFPTHPNTSFPKQCGAALMRSVIHPSNTNCLRPDKVYSYQSLKAGVSRLLKRKKFLDKCEQWRNRPTLPGYLGDIYDGQVWKDFQHFLSQHHSWCVALNVDWFQPFTHVPDSVGALYLIVLNLPREERYKRENMILVGVIPGPHEPSLHINSYLAPLVMELHDFYMGIDISCISADGKRFSSRTIRLALTGVFCDLPASRKVCGGPSFIALDGCNRCLKTFVTASFGERPDYSGYNKQSWPTRNLDIHRQKCLEYINCKTRSAQKYIEREHELRYSVLIDLPYFNPIRYTAIDPMHNLFLGTAKHCMEVWLSKSILSKRDLQVIEQKITKLRAPHSAGRLPLKISSGFSGFTADQWKNWTLSYSSVALRGILLQEHLQYWLLYVKACSLICVRYLSIQNIELSDKYFKLFCCKFLDVNGAQCCTPNMHLHMHLKECLLDYGPPYSFWCYGFERFNGILGSFPTNKKYIEPQLKKKCLMLQELHNYTFPEEGEQFQHILNGHLPSISGSLLTSMGNDFDWSRYMVLSDPVLDKQLSFVVGCSEKCIPPIKQSVLDSDKVKLLEGMYRFLYLEASFQAINRFAQQSSRAFCFNEVFGSKSSSRKQHGGLCLLACYGGKLVSYSTR